MPDRLGRSTEQTVRGLIYFHQFSYVVGMDKSMINMFLGADRCAKETTLD